MMGCGKSSDDEEGAAAGGGGGAEQITVAFVPKLVGIPYFTAMENGGKQAAEELGVKFVYEGPTTADSAKQIEVINSLITQNVDVLAVAPNDPAAVKPILERAAEQGIKVLTSDTDAPDAPREVWVNQATSEAIGTAVVEALASQMDGKGKWAIVSCGPTAQNLNGWIEVQKQVAKEKYPDMELIGVKFAGEDQQAAVKIAKDLMTANPDLKGLVGECTTSAPGVAQAITEMKKVGDVVSTGIGTPTAMAEYIESGAQAKVVLWDPQNLGYLTVWAGKQLAEGKALQAENEVGPPVGTAKFTEADKQLLLGPPITFDESNIAEYDGKF
jgi:rhamnose transport system substrate-binding protein